MDVQKKLLLLLPFFSLLGPFSSPCHGKSLSSTDDRLDETMLEVVASTDVDEVEDEAEEEEEEERKYLPTWESLDSRPLPEWFDRARIGIFIHFGVFSVPSYLSEWFWCYWQCPWALKPAAAKYIEDHYPPGWTYQDFARDFKLDFFNATEWVELFERAGARYAVLTSKHHEGYTLWPSKYSYSWNSVDIGPGRDVVGEFAEAIRNHSSLRLGLYHSYYEWFNPLGLAENSREENTTRLFPRNKVEPELYELVNNYKPDLIWSDGAEGPEEYWNSTGFLAWLYNDSPVKKEVIVNDRWADGTSCKHGGYFNCADRYNPGTKVPRKWENAMTLDRYSWGYRRNADIRDYLSVEELLRTLVETVSNGGNLLVNVGPTSDGTIPPVMQERLHQMGDFLAVNGEAIYDSQEWRSRNDSTAHDLFYTVSRDGRSALYAIMLVWPEDGILVLSEPVPTTFTRISLLGHDSGEEGLDWKVRGGGYLEIWLPDMARVQHLKYAWVLKITEFREEEHREEEEEHQDEGEKEKHQDEGQKEEHQDDEDEEHHDDGDEHHEEDHEEDEEHHEVSEEEESHTDEREPHEEESPEKGENGSNNEDEESHLDKIVANGQIEN